MPQGRTQMKSWEPDQEFERADFPRARKTPEKQIPAKSSETKEVKAWRPPSLSDGAGAAKAPLSVKKAPKLEKQELPRGQVIRGPVAAPVKGGFSASILGDSIIENLESSATQLRHLYWDKKSSAISSRRKIKVIVSYAGARAIKALSSILTPMERQQFLELVKTEAACDGQTVEQVCREFIAKIAKV